MEETSIDWSQYMWMRNPGPEPGGSAWTLRTGNNPVAYVIRHGETFEARIVVPVTSENPIGQQTIGGPHPSLAEATKAATNALEVEATKMVKKVVKKTSTEWDGEGFSPWLYAKTAAGAVNVWRCWTEDDTVTVEWGQEGGSLQVAEFRCQPKNVGKANATTAEEQARAEALSKFKKQLKKKYFPTRGGAQTKLNFKPMLAKVYKDRIKKIQFPVDVQFKFNGVRCLAHWVDGEVVLMSRGGDPYDIPHIQAALEGCLEEGRVLDGELYHHGTSLQTITSWAKRLQADTANLIYCVYDTIDMALLDEPWEARRQDLDRWYRAHHAEVEDVVIHARSFEAHTPEQVKGLHDEFVRSGYEGAIIRLRHGQYRFGYRSSELLKFKEFDDAEFEVVGWTTGKPGSGWENVPIFRLKTEGGRFFEAAPKGSMELRAQMLREADSYIGRPMTVRYFGFTDEGVPSLPVGLGIRDRGT